LKKSTEIRQDFLDFFAAKGHKIVPSASVIPYDDPTLLFTNAGMNQFKDVFLGTGTRDYVKCADTQKCIRVSGKHNDLEEVGHDGYHHTFFEMLGNWSFGDYYKKEAIEYAWELLTKVWGLSKERLWVTYFRDDLETKNLWQTLTDINHSHILQFDEKDNFWEMGDTGPCGPCSEIHYDFTENGGKAEDVNSDNPDVMEIWNLVFIQYKRDKDGTLHELPKRHVDTGMGFERIVRVLQNKKSNYETDVFLPLINELIHLTGKDYSSPSGRPGGVQASMNVIADHIRTLTVAIADGAIPSSEGRGYVLRRILRRAARYGRNLEMQKPFIYNLVDILVETMGHVFPELIDKHKFIKEVIQGEEESFNLTLDRGLTYFNEEIENMKKSGSKIFSGEVAFKLHDTYGFPVDLTQLMAKEKGYELDVLKFDEMMSVQRERAGKLLNGWEETSDSLYTEAFIKKGIVISKKSYNPYINESQFSTKIIDTLSQIPTRTGLIISYNSFYKESGGQAGDTGLIDFGNGLCHKVVNVYNNNIIEIDEAPIVIHNKLGEIHNKNVTARIDFPRRQSIQRNHSATHLMHEALRRVLGPHIKQMGSYLDDQILRFDFPHFHKLRDDEIKAIEDIVNDKVKENIKVVTEVDVPLEEARKIPHVKMFFGEKYADKVRVVFIDEKFSVELCGGTHVKDTSDIGLFKITKEESISSGTRRIIARTGEGIIHLIDEKVADIEKIISELPEKYLSDFKSGIENFRKDFKSADFKDTTLLTKLIQYQDATLYSLYELREKHLEEKKQLEKQLAKNKVKDASASIEELIKNAQPLNGFKVVTGKFDSDNMDELKEIGDSLRGKIGSGVGLLYSVINGKVSLVAVVSDDLVKKGLSAGKIAGDVAKILGGGGGGKPHLATAGGKDVLKIDEALESLNSIITKYLK